MATNNTVPAKKKRPDDPTNAPDTNGQKPVPLQRRRVWRACESCRKKKVKCDGNEPTCTQCLTSGSQCTWLQTKDRAALSRHYVQELEARLLQMESLFRQVAPTLQQLGQLPPGVGIDGVLSTPAEGFAISGPPAIAQVLGSQERPTYSPSSDPHGLDSSHAIKIEEEEDDFAESQLAQDEHGSYRWMGNSSTMSLIHSFKSLTTDPTQRVGQRGSPGDGEMRGSKANKLYFPASVFFGKVRALPGPEEVEYPDRDLADKLVDAYFTRLHFLLPVIDKTGFMSKFNVLMDNTRNVPLHRSETAFISLVFAVFACASRLVEDSRLQTKIGDTNEDGGMGMVYYERALVLQYISHASVQMYHVQCFTLMSSFLCSVNCLPQAWLLIGQAVRSGQDLGLHRSPRGLIISALEKEHRRKTWWGVYTMDRMLAVALGRPLGVDERDCDVELCVPVDDDDLAAYFEGNNVQRDAPALMAGSVSLVTLYEIAGRVLRQVYSIDVFMEDLDPQRKVELQRTVESLDQELIKWCDELPLVFKSHPRNERDVSMGAVLCSHYYSIVSTLHRNFLPINKEHIPSAKSTSKAVTSARACIHLAPSIKNVVPASHHLAFFIQNLFSSSVIILLYAMHVVNAQAAAQALDTAHNSIEALEAWEGQWPGARKCRELLNDLACTAAEAMKAGPRAAPPAPSPSLSMGSPGLTLSTSNVPPVAGPSSPRSPTTRFDPATLTSGSRPGALRSRSSKPRRDRSHDPYTHTRQGSRSGPSYKDAMAQRARSTSRVRGYDDIDRVDHHGVIPYPAVATVSSHSSPASGQSGSPREAALEALPAHASPKMASPTFGMAPLHVPASSRQFDYSLGQQIPGYTPVSAVSPDWSQIHSQTSGDLSANLVFNPGQDPNMLWLGFNGSSGSGTASPNGYYPYDPSNLSLNMGMQAPALPNPSFSGPGLPFSGLDFIRNYSTDGLGNPTAEDSLWQAIDPRAFHNEPDVPWSLVDLPPIEEQNVPS